MATVPRRLSRTEFRRWAEAQPRGRYERVSGEVVAMSPKRAVHVRLKTRVWRALDAAVRAAGLPCETFGDGMTVEIDDDTDYEPDALVNCGDKIDPQSVVAPHPVVIVEVLSPSTQAVDAGGKLADYFRVASVRHYLLVRPQRPEIIHHRRTGDRIETRVVTAGRIELDPPGIGFLVEEVYGA